MLYGGSRSGKTMLICRAIAIRSIRAPRSSHAILRFRRNALEGSIISDTWPKMMRGFFPEIRYRLNRRDYCYEMPGNSLVWLGGLDDKDRTEKILGTEHAGIFLNETSQITYDARNKAVTRMAQKAVTADGAPLTLRMWYDQNPPNRGHWTYRLFEKKIEPKSGEALEYPDAYASMQINPDSNQQNLDGAYFQQLDSLPARDRLRFRAGEYAAQVENALWNFEELRRERAPRTEAERRDLLARMVRIVVAVDPSGCEGPEDYRSDEIGIVVCGRDRAGAGYVLEDRSGRYSPRQWGNAVVSAYDDWDSDNIIAERNFGGAMVEATIKASRQNVPVTIITASRGKVARAEPVAALYERTPAQRDARIVHVGQFPDLEEQMGNFSTGGYLGGTSPDRADAMIWGMTELMLDGRGPIQIDRSVLKKAAQPRSPIHLPGMESVLARFQR